MKTSRAATNCLSIILYPSSSVSNNLNIRNNELMYRRQIMASKAIYLLKLGITHNIYY